MRLVSREGLLIAERALNYKPSHSDMGIWVRFLCARTKRVTPGKILVNLIKERTEVDIKVISGRRIATFDLLLPGSAHRTRCFKEKVRVKLTRVK